MNSIVENLTGMDIMTDQVIATDFLISAKNGVRNYAIALTEAATPEVREILRKHLEDAISTHERITEYMMNNEMYHVYNVNEQIQLDIQSAETAQNLPNRSNSVF